MKALTLTQPWATLVAIGAKTIETRSWGTTFRGALAIHAAKGFPRDAIALCFEEPFRGALARAGYTTPGELPRGEIVAWCDLVDVLPTDSEFVQTALQEWPDERAFGNYEPGRSALLLSNTWRVTKPVPCKGALGLWDIPDGVWNLLQKAELKPVPTQLVFGRMQV